MQIYQKSYLDNEYKKVQKMERSLYNLTKPIIYNEAMNAERTHYLNKVE